MRKTCLQLSGKDTGRYFHTLDYFSDFSGTVSLADVCLCICTGTKGSHIKRAVCLWSVFNHPLDMELQNVLKKCHSTWNEWGKQVYQWILWRLACWQGWSMWYVQRTWGGSRFNSFEYMQWGLKTQRHAKVKFWNIHVDFLCVSMQTIVEDLMHNISISFFYICELAYIYWNIHLTTPWEGLLLCRPTGVERHLW